MKLLHNFGRCGVEREIDEGGFAPVRSGCAVHRPVFKSMWIDEHDDTTWIFTGLNQHISQRMTLVSTRHQKLPDSPDLTWIPRIPRSPGAASSMTARGEQWRVMCSTFIPRCQRSTVLIASRSFVARRASVCRSSCGDRHRSLGSVRETREALRNLPFRVLSVLLQGRQDVAWTAKPSTRCSHHL